MVEEHVLLALGEAKRCEVVCKGIVLWIIGPVLGKGLFESGAQMHGMEYDIFPHVDKVGQERRNVDIAGKEEEYRRVDWPIGSAGVDGFKEQARARCQCANNC